LVRNETAVLATLEEEPTMVFQPWNKSLQALAKI
jgi:hypothetical protein